jgi:hypothetical protein
MDKKMGPSPQQMTARLLAEMRASQAEVKEEMKSLQGTRGNHRKCHRGDRVTSGKGGGGQSKGIQTGYKWPYGDHHKLR